MIKSFNQFINENNEDYLSREEVEKMGLTWDEYIEKKTYSQTT